MQPTDMIAAITATAALPPALWLLSAYRSRVASVGRAIRHTAVSQTASGNASVIVLSGNDSEALERLLDRIFSQNFDSQMEVIVVNDGKSENVKDVVTRMRNSRRANNLHITFTPPETRNVSHRKLSITLGVKAARHPVAVIIDEQSAIPSDRWLTAMTSPFADEQIQIVLGSALPDPEADISPKGSKGYRAFTHAADAVAWLSAALRHCPYRGCGGNIAYRRQLFFDNKGFSSALNLRDGDDDIFISRVATAANTAVELS
ncbi:MAG: glycosyltransferase, partial [Muribaculaceae bacterium]|nr:glycosyltransferase [Muribaculaceae bacterium]